MLITQYYCVDKKYAVQANGATSKALQYVFSFPRLFPEHRTTWAFHDGWNIALPVSSKTSLAHAQSLESGARPRPAAALLSH